MSLRTEFSEKSLSLIFTDSGISFKITGIRNKNKAPIMKNVPSKPNKVYRVEPTIGPINNPTPIIALKIPKYFWPSL